MMATLQNNLWRYDDTTHHTVMATSTAFPELITITGSITTVPSHSIASESLI